MMNSSVRRKIFPPLPEHHDVMPIRLTQIPQHSDQQFSSPTAEQLLRHSSSFLISIETVLSRIAYFKQHFEQDRAVNSDSNNAKFMISKTKFDLNNTQLLHGYHMEITDMQQRDIEYRQFKVSCVTNLNDPNTKLQLEYSEEQALNKIKEHIQTIRELREKLQEKLYEYQYSISNSRILNKIQTLDICISDLKSYLQRHGPEMNLFMLNLLVRLESLHEQYIRAIDQHISFHCRFSSITDNLLAMEHQKKNMKDHIEEMSSHFRKIDDVLQNSKCQIAIAQRNDVSEKLSNLAEIYDSNYKMFTRMAPEAYTTQYPIYLSNYRDTYIQFTDSYKQYLKNSQIFDKFLKNLIEANDVGRRAIAHPNDTDKGKLNRLYHNTLSLQPPVEVSNTKERVLALIEKDMKLLGQPLPVRDRVNVRTLFMKLQMGKFIRYFQRLEQEGVQYLMSSKDTILEYRYELRNIHSRQTEQNTFIKNYLGYFNIALAQHTFLSDIQKDHFRLIRQSWRSQGSIQIEKEIYSKVYKIEELYSDIWRGMPVGLQKCLYNSVRDVFILTSYCIVWYKRILLKLTNQKKIFKQSLKTKRLAVAVNDMFPNQILDILVLETTRQLHTMSDDNKRLKTFMLDNFLSVYKEYIQVTIEQQHLSHQLLESEFVFSGQNRFFDFYSLYFMNLVGPSKVLPNFFLLVDGAIKTICDKWKSMQIEEKMRTLIRLNILLDVLQHYNTKIIKYTLYKQTLEYLHRLLRSQLELEAIARGYKNFQLPGLIRGIVYILTVLKEMSQLVYNPPYKNDKISATILQFTRSLKEQGLITVDRGSDINRILINMDALKAQLDLSELKLHNELFKIHKIAILYFYITAMRKLVNSKQLFQSTDRLKIFTGEKFEVIDFTNTKYYTMAQRIIVVYADWVPYVFNILRDKNYSIINNEPKDSNLEKVVGWALE